MDKKIYELHAALCQTMANSVRLEIIDMLRTGEKAAGELAILAGVSQANMSQHLKILRQQGVITSRRDGVRTYFRVSNQKMLNAFDMLREILVEQLGQHAKLVKHAEAAAGKIKR